MQVQYKQSRESARAYAKQVGGKFKDFGKDNPDGRWGVIIEASETGSMFDAQYGVSGQQDKQPVEPKAKPEKVSRKAKTGPTTKQQAVPIVADMLSAGNKRREVTAVLMEKFDISQHCANTYYHNVKSALKGNEKLIKQGWGVSS